VSELTAEDLGNKQLGPDREAEKGELYITTLDQIGVYA
jgi:hypothetical protein